MIRDPFYQQIVAGPNSRLDPETFERCAVDLLRPIYPGLVPVRGGGDAGMDGACADGNGPAYPLVCTTGKAVLANLKGSLESYRKAGGMRRHVILATSRQLSPRRRRNLEAAGGRLGFTVVQVHDQADFADRLYRDPGWCLELLSLTGSPPPLSALPLQSRPALTSTLIGRQEDLAWLRNGPGDLLLVGQPGSGKTFLLSALVQEGKALFVVSQDMGQIASAYRAQQPDVLLVDDAHLHDDLLPRLRQFRAQTGAHFHIVADCWPGDQDAVARALDVTPGAIRCLDPLPRTQIVEVIRACGVSGPNGLLHELVRQADGRPGLAVTLCHLCLREGTRDIVLGDALCRDIRTTFEPLVGREATTVMAAFAVGGDGGMPLAAVARELGVTLLDLRTMASRLAAGGVLVESGRHCLAVRPEALRHALVRDVFFNDPAPLSITGLLDRAPYWEGVVRTLIGARGRGGRIDLQFVAGLFAGAPLSDETWLAFASLGPDESRLVLHEYPEKLLAVASAALDHVPQEAIPLLLAAEQQEQPQGKTPGRPLAVIANWATSAYPGTGEPVRRREMLLQNVLAWLTNDGDRMTALRAVRVALSPDFTDWESDPGKRYTIIHRSGYVTIDEATAIQEFWPRVPERLAVTPMEDWSPLQELIRDWAYPSRMAAPVSRAMVSRMVRFARRLLRDSVQIARDRPAFLHWALQLGDALDVRLRVRLDPEFVTLYPFRESDDWQQAQQEQAEAARELAGRWLTADPTLVARQLAAWEAEMRAAEGRVWPCWSPFVCAELAERTPTPGEWVEALCRAGASGELVGPFLYRAVALNEPGWAERLRGALEQPSLRGAAVVVVLQMTDPPDDLLALAMASLTGLAGLVNSLCMRGAIPESRVGSLLNHNDGHIASAAALGEWYAPPVGVIKPTLWSAWRDAILRCGDDLPDVVLRADPDLPRGWLAARFLDSTNFLWQERHTAQLAYTALDDAQRRYLLERVPPDAPWASQAVQHLVGDDLDLYKAVLIAEQLKRHHLVPLRGRPAGAWVSKAIAALDAGYTPEEIVDAVHRGGWGWNSGTSARWAEAAKQFGLLEAHADARIRRLGQIGREDAENCLERARRRERKEAVHGEW